MKNASLVRCTALIAVLALAIPLVAKPVTKEFDLLVPARVGHTQLRTGKYRVVVDGPKVTIRQGKNVVVELEGRFEERQQRQSRNSVLVGSDGAVKEIRFAGDRRVLVLGN
jgi:hypothetical protein